MRTAMRPYLTAGVALVGASVVAAAPIAPPQAHLDARANIAMRTASPAVSLAANSILNVPQNLWNAFASSTAWHVEGVQLLADALASSGNWNVDSGNPNNVWGWDPANPPMLEGMVRMIAPYRPFSDPLAYQMNAWAKANLPMHPGCPAFSCPEPEAILGVMFKVPIWQFWRPEGVTFGEDQYTPEFNPVGGEPVPWYGENVQFSPSDPITSFFKYLLRDPADQPEEFQAKRTTLYDVVSAYADLARALQVTGHLPSFIAVDEIETFVKLFVPKPAAEPEADLQETPDVETPAAAAPQLKLARTVTLDVPAAGDETDEATSTPSEGSGPAATETAKLSDADADVDTVSPPAEPEAAEELDKVTPPAVSEPEAETETETETDADAAEKAAAEADPDPKTTPSQTRKKRESQTSESSESSAGGNAAQQGGRHRSEQGGRHRAEDRQKADSGTDSSGSDGAAAA